MKITRLLNLMLNFVIRNKMVGKIIFGNIKMYIRKC